MNEPLYDEHGNIVGEPVYDDDGNVVDYIQEGLYDDEENPPDEGGLPEEYADLEGKPCWPVLSCGISCMTHAVYMDTHRPGYIMQQRRCLTRMSA